TANKGAGSCVRFSGFQIRIKRFVQCLFAATNDHTHQGIPGDVDGGAQHIQQAIDAYDQGDSLRRQADLLQYHRQGNQTDPGHPGGTDGRKGSGEDNQQIVGKGQLQSERLGNKDGGHALHNGGAVHIDGGAERNHKSGHAVIHSQPLLGITQVDRNGGTAGGGTEGKHLHGAHFAQKGPGRQTRKGFQQQRVNHQRLHQQGGDDG